MKRSSYYNDQGNTDLHKYACSGELQKFKVSLEKFKRVYPNNYIEIVSHNNKLRETALSLAIENENFDIAIYLLSQLTSEQRDNQLDRLVSVDSEKFDKLLNRAKTEDKKEITKLLSHTASELKRNRHGGDYQLQWLMLVAWQGHGSDIQFRLGTEVSEAGKFDDLVFRYKDSDGKFKYRYLQVKHEQHLRKSLKISQFTRQGHKYELKKYFTTYLVVDDPSQVDNLVLCTNNYFGFDPEDFHFQEIGQEIREGENKYKIFSDLGGKLYKFNFKDDDDRNDFIKELFKDDPPIDKDKRNKIEIFLSKFVFAVEQPNSLELGKKIKKKMGSNAFNFITYGSFSQYMSEWFSERARDNTARFILSSEVKGFFDELKNKIANIELNGLAPLFEKKIGKFKERGLSFREDSDVKKVKEFLNQISYRILKLIYEEKDAFLSIAKVYQTLKELYIDTTRYTVSDLQSLSLLNFDSSSQERVVNALKSENKHLLVIECSFIDENGKNLISRLCEEVLAKPSKKVILVLNKEVNNKLNQIFPNLSGINVAVIENKFNSLTTESQDKILDTEIIFYGNKKKLGSLISVNQEQNINEDDLCLAINGDALTALINDDSNIIGSKHEYEFDTFIDIPRTLNYQTKIDKKCLKENDNDLFAISDIKESELSGLVPEEQKIRKFQDDDDDKENNPIRFIMLDNINTRENFNQLCCNYKMRTIHLLENKIGELEWKQSHGSLFDLRKFILKTENTKKQVKDLTDSVVVIAANPGMGKSTILTTYSIKSDSLWCIRINLRDHEMHIENANFNDPSKIVNFLSIICPADLKTSLAKSLLQYRLKRQGQVTLLLDGYDEIKDHTQEKVVQLLKALKTTQGKVLLTTRLYTKRQLEDALELFSYTLNPFSTGDQKQFFQEFWVEKLSKKQKPLSEEHRQRVEDFTEKFLEHFHNLNLMKEKGFVGIALQARMLAEVFQDTFDEYLINSNKKLDFPNIDIFDLYEHFIDVQYRIYLGVKVDVKLGDGSKDSLTRSYTTEYGYLALKTLFLEDQTFKELLRGQRFTQNELNKIGLIKKFKDKSNDTADFIHPSYAEYFVAKLLVDMLDKNKNNPKYNLACEFLLTHIFRDRNKVIRDFIENSVKKENNQNLKDKWKAVQDCDLLGEKKSIETYVFSGEQHNVLPLNELLQKFQEVTPEGMYLGKNGYYYNGPTEIISDLFYSFNKEKDVKTLQDALDYLLKIQNNGGLHLGIGNKIILDNLHNAINHYFVEAKQQDKLDYKFLKKVDKDKSYAYIYSDLNTILNDILEKREQKRLYKLLGNFITATDEILKEQCIKSLVNVLIPANVKFLEDLSKLNNLYYFLDISDSYKGIIKKISSYINSNKSVQRFYQEKIIGLLKSITTDKDSAIDKALKPLEFEKPLQSFFIDITHHPNSIEYTKLSVNKIFKEEEGKNLFWVERQGIVISRFLKILTLEMPERFIYVVHGSSGNYALYGLRNICNNLIDHILDMVKTEELPQINKPAFLKILTYFTKFKIKVHEPLTPNQFETVLKYIECMLNKQYIFVPEVLECIEYLFVLGEAGLKLISTDQKLLVLDPASEFQYELSSGHKTQIIKLIKWRSKHPDRPKSEFLKRCYEIVELRKNKLKRRGSETSVQESKKFKVENCQIEEK